MTRVDEYPRTLKQMIPPLDFDQNFKKKKLKKKSYQTKKKKKKVILNYIKCKLHAL